MDGVAEVRQLLFGYQVPFFQSRRSVPVMRGTLQRVHRYHRESSVVLAAIPSTGRIAVSGGKRLSTEILYQHQIRIDAVDLRPKNVAAIPGYE